MSCYDSTLRQCKYSRALLNGGFAVLDGPRASTECEGPDKQSHIGSMTMNLTEEKPALIKRRSKAGF